MAERILEQRARRPFADWVDLVARVRGLGGARAIRLSAQGLTVAGKRYPMEPVPGGKAAAKP
jgi:competence protein ComEA